MKRFLKIVAILALFAVVIAYVAFRVLFFDPFGSTRAELDPLIPPDVDVMIRRRDLEKDFDPFPMPRFFKSLRIKEDWSALARSKLYKEFEPQLGIERLYAEAEKLPEQMKPLDLMADLAGREAMLVGRWRADGNFAFAALVRGSFRAKFAAEAVKFSVVRKSQGDLIQSYGEQEGVKSLKVNGQAWHLFRVDDVLVAGNDFDLVRDIHKLSVGEGRSLLDSPQYRAAVIPQSPLGRTLDFVVDVGDVAKHLHLEWPHPEGTELLGLRFLRELFAPERFGQAMGRIATGSQVELSFDALADLAGLRPPSGGLLEAQSADLNAMWRFCGSVFPDKVAVTGYVRADVKAFLRRIEGLLDKDTRQLLNDAIGALRSPDKQLQFKSTVELLDAFAGLVTSEFAFAIEPDAPYSVPDRPDQVLVPEPRWGPRVAVVFPLSDKDLAEQFVERVYKAISSRQGTVVSNAWNWSYPNGQRFREVKSVDNDMPTFAFGFLQLMKRECIVFTTTGKFLDEIVHQKFDVETAAAASQAQPIPGLMSVLQYKQAEEAVKGYGQGFVFASGPNLHDVIYNLCPVFAENATRPDWVVVRHKVEGEITAKRFPKGANTESEKKQRETLVDAEMERLEKEWREVTLAQATELLRNDVAALAMLRWSTLTWRVNERDLEMKLRLATPATFPND